MVHPKTILLTGATGNLGAVILESLLQSKYNIRAIVRSVEKNRKYFEDHYEAESATAQLTLIEAPDLAVSGVFDERVKGVEAIVHVATPLAFDKFWEMVIEPAWLINKNILGAASSSKSVQRITITGSVVSKLQIPERVTITGANYNPIALDE
jgi:NADPH-dependent methylglyoxal reductase